MKAKDVRREPPIPVERTIVTEKANNEKLEKIAVGTLVPEAKEIVETIKTLNENLNEQSQIVVNTGIAKPDESVITLKAEEKIKMIEEKERSMDLQKNDNLINLDAIKKEESELAADGDVANARAAERHEQLRKTLEKHKLEQRQMMQEQREILKDIKEQKQEFEREKQRMAKDEISKKSEKKMQIDAKENILPKDKNDLKENDKKSAEIGAIEKSVLNREIFDDKERSLIDETRFDEKLRMPDRINDANVAVKDSAKNLDLLQEVSRDKNVEEKLLISQNAPKSLPDKEMVDFEQSIRKDENKMRKVEFNNSEDMKGPILNALSKGVLQRSVAEDDLTKGNDNRQVKEEKRDVLTDEMINASDKSQGKYEEARFPLPIALKMTNHSKVSEAIVPPSNKSEPVVQSMRRDILENYEREKRDTNMELNKIDIKDNDRLIEKSKFLIKDVNDANSETCWKSQETSTKLEAESEKEEESEKRIIKSSTTEISLIKTNIHLSDQGITRPISIDTPVALHAEYVNMKQRDLKALNPKNNI